MRRTKYRAKKVVTQDGTFDSKKEYSRWLELKKMEEQGVITKLQRQVRFPLLPTQKDPDRIGPKGGTIKGRVLERKVDYIADFVYTTHTGRLVVEDAKGYRTPEYILKRKMALYLLGIRIVEV